MLQQNTNVYSFTRANPGALFFMQGPDKHVERAPHVADSTEESDAVQENLELATAPETLAPVLDQVSSEPAVIAVPVDVSDIQDSVKKPKPWRIVAILAALLLIGTVSCVVLLRSKPNNCVNFTQEIVSSLAHNYVVPSKSKDDKVNISIVANTFEINGLKSVKNRSFPLITNAKVKHSNLNGLALHFDFTGTAIDAASVLLSQKIYCIHMLFNDNIISNSIALNAEPSVIFPTKTFEDLIYSNISSQKTQAAILNVAAKLWHSLLCNGEASGCRPHVAARNLMNNKLAHRIRHIFVIAATHRTTKNSNVQYSNVVDVSFHKFAFGWFDGISPGRLAGTPFTFFCKFLFEMAVATFHAETPTESHKFYLTLLFISGGFDYITGLTLCRPQDPLWTMHRCVSGQSFVSFVNGITGGIRAYSAIEAT